MIKAKITSKTGASLEWELPANIHQLYHNMCSPVKKKHKIK